MISQPIIIPLEPVLIYKDTDKSVTMSNFIGFIIWPCAIIRNNAKKFSETLLWRIEAFSLLNILPLNCLLQGSLHTHPPPATSKIKGGGSGSWRCPHRDIIPRPRPHSPLAHMSPWVTAEESMHGRGLLFLHEYRLLSSLYFCQKSRLFFQV